MKKFSFALLTTLALVLTFTSLMSANAEVQLPAHIKLKGYALGRCLVVNPSANPYILGSGSIALNGYAEAPIYGEFNTPWCQMFGWYFATAPGGYVDAIGFLAVRWFEDRTLHQLSLVIYSTPATQANLQPETDKFAIGWFENSALRYRGVYKIGSSSQYVSGGIMVWGTGTDMDYIMAGIWFGGYQIPIIWVKETVVISETLTVPAATIFMRNVELL